MKRVLGLLFILVVGLSLVACGEKELTLNTVSMFGGTDANRGIYSNTLLEYQNKNDIRIKDNSGTSDEEWKTSVINMFKNGTEPDVLQFFTGETAKPFVEQGLVMSIEDIRKEYPTYANNITPSVLGTHSVPTTGFVEGIFVNTDHFKTAESKAYLNKDSWTWAEFKTLLGLLKTENGAIDGYAPIAYGLNVPHYWIDHLVAAEHGDDYYNVIKGAGGADKMATALYRLNEIEQYLSKSNNEEIASQNFLDGKYTFQLDGSWFAGRIELENVKVFPFPSINDNGTPLLSGYTSGFYITKKAWNNPKKRDLAVKLVMELTSTKKLSDFVTVGGGFAADENAKPKEENAIQTALRLLAGKTDFVALPLGDASAADSYPILVEAQASFVTKNQTTAKKAIEEYLKKQ